MEWEGGGEEGLPLSLLKDLRPTWRVRCQLPRSADSAAPCPVVIKAIGWVWVEGSGLFLFCDLKNEFPVGFLVHEKESGKKKVAETEVRVSTNNQIP